MNKKLKSKLIKNKIGNIKNVDNNISIWLENSEMTSKIEYNKKTNKIFHNGEDIGGINEFKVKVKISCSDELGFDIKKKSFDERFAIFLDNHLCDTVIDDFTQSGMSIDELNDKKEPLKENSRDWWISQMPYTYTNEKTGEVLPVCTKDSRKIYLNTKKFLEINNRKYKLSMNLFSGLSECNGEPMSDTIYKKIKDFMTTILFKPIIDDLDTAITNVSCEDEYHPIKQYLNSLDISNIENPDEILENVFIKWNNVIDLPIVRVMSKKWFVSVIKRCLEPGCNTEGIIGLVGEQGLAKTLFFERIAQPIGYGTFSLNDVTDDQKIIQNLGDKAIIVFEELCGKNKKDNAEIKQFTTRNVFEDRLAWGHNRTTLKNHFAFAFNSNETEILNDFTTESDERRWWCLKTRQFKNSTDEYNVGSYIYNKLNKEEVDKIWAAAYKIYKENKDFNCTLSLSERNMLKEYQVQFKKGGSDYVILRVVDKLNNGLFRLNSKGMFESIDDMVKQLQSSNSMYECGGMQHIKAIPEKWLETFSKYLTNETRPMNKIKAFVGDEWKRTQRIINNEKINCISRKVIDAVDDTMSQQDDDFFSQH